MVKVVPVFLTLAGVERSSDKLAATAGGAAAATMLTSTRTLLATNNNGARTIDLIAVPPRLLA